MSSAIVFGSKRDFRSMKREGWFIHAEWGGAKYHADVDFGTDQSVVIITDHFDRIGVDVAQLPKGESSIMVLNSNDWSLAVLTVNSTRVVGQFPVWQIPVLGSIRHLTHNPYYTKILMEHSVGLKDQNRVNDTVRNLILLCRQFLTGILKPDELSQLDLNALLDSARKASIIRGLILKDTKIGDRDSGVHAVSWFEEQVIKILKQESCQDFDDDYQQQVDSLMDIEEPIVERFDSIEERDDIAPEDSEIWF